MIEKILMVVLGLVVAAVVWAPIHNAHHRHEVALRFNVSEGDLKAFINSTHYDYSDFENSEGVRANFERWRKGEGVIGRKTDSVYVPIVMPVSSGR